MSSKPKVLTPDDVLDPDRDRTELRLVKVPCPEWGGDVYLGTPTSADRDKLDGRFSRLNEDDDDQRYLGVRAAWVAACWRDDEGNRVGITPAQVDALNEESAAPMDRLFGAAQSLSGLTSDDIDALAKNWPRDESGDSG